MMQVRYQLRLRQSGPCQNATVITNHGDVTAGIIIISGVTVIQASDVIMENDGQMVINLVCGGKRIN